MLCSKNSLSWSLRSRKFKSLILLTGAVLIVYSIQVPLYTLYLFSDQNITDYEVQGEKSVSLRIFDRTDTFPEKIVHLDFKGAPPRVEYLVSLMPIIKEMGATGILLEYEDTFPYHGELEGITALNAYTRSDVLAIAQAAESNNLSVIPLIPTFSHLEFVLKLEQYKHFREIDDNPETICPSELGVYKILQKMIDQVLELHAKSTYLHVGCDEVNILGVCPKCRNVMKENSLQKDDIYLGHIRRIAEYISNTHPTVRTIVWGNGLAQQKRSSLFYNQIPQLVDIMLSNYKIDHDSYPSELDMHFFAQVFPKIWIAGSFKGSTGIRQMVTDIDFHLINFRLWMDFMNQWKSAVDFKGVVLTGFQRRSHFDVLCELLPVSIPSLAVNLRSLEGTLDFDYDFIKQSLTCNDVVPLSVKEFLNLEQLDALLCNFPGFEVYRLVHYFYNAVIGTKELFVKLDVEELSFYNILHSEWKSSYVNALTMRKYKDQLQKLIELEQAIKFALLKIYDNYTVSEWIMTNIFPIRMQLQTAVAATDPLLKRKVWPRRPLTNDLSHFQTTLNTICHKNDTVGCTFIFAKVT